MVGEFGEVLVLDWGIAAEFRDCGFADCGSMRIRLSARPTTWRPSRRGATPASITAPTCSRSGRCSPGSPRVGADRRDRAKGAVAGSGVAVSIGRSAGRRRQPLPRRPRRRSAPRAAARPPRSRRPPPSPADSARADLYRRAGSAALFVSRVGLRGQVRSRVGRSRTSRSRVAPKAVVDSRALKAGAGRRVIEPLEAFA